MDNVYTQSCYNAAKDGISELETKSIQAYDLSEKLENLEGAIADREAAIYSDVCAEIDSATGKPLFTNDGARKAAASKLSSEDAILVTMRGELRSWKRERAVLQASIDRLRREVQLNTAYVHAS